MRAVWRTGGIVLLIVAAAVALLFVSGRHSAAPAEIYQLGLSASQNEDWETVRDCIRGLEVNPDYLPHASLLRGLELKSRGLTDRALLSLSAANRHQETREASYFHGAAIYFQRKQYHTCIPMFRQVIQWNADHLESHRLLAAASYDIGAMEQSIASLEQVMRLSPDDYRPHYLQATILQDFERYADSANSFRKAAELAPPDTAVADEIRAEWGDCLIRLRRFEEALESLRGARDWPDVLARRAQASFSLRRFEDARKDSEEALKKQPLHVEAVIVAAQLDERDGNTSLGIQRLQAALEQAPVDLRLHQRLADLLATVGETDKAVHHRQQAGNIAEIRQQFSITLQQVVGDNENAELRLRLADLAEKLGEIEHAANWYRAALGMSPGNAEIHQRWQRFLADHPSFATGSDAEVEAEASAESTLKSSAQPAREF